MGLVLGGDLQECGDFAWRVSDCEKLVGVIHKRCGIRLWKVIKRNNRSGSYIFNRCSVQISCFV
jgi:hypothetical protein